MPAVMTFGWAPNHVYCCDVDNTTDWHVLASDGSGYASLAALAAAGKIPFGTGYNDASAVQHLKDPGLFWQVLNVESDNGSFGAGGGFLMSFNQVVAPTHSPQGVVCVLPGMNKTYAGQFANLWIAKVTGTDRLFFEACY